MAARSSDDRRDECLFSFLRTVSGYIHGCQSPTSATTFGCMKILARFRRSSMLVAALIITFAVLPGCKRDSSETNSSRAPRREPVTEYGQAVKKARDANKALAAHDRDAEKALEEFRDE